MCFKLAQLMDLKMKTRFSIGATVAEIFFLSETQDYTLSLFPVKTQMRERLEEKGCKGAEEEWG